MDRKFALTGLGYAIAGLILGIVMAATKDHGQLVTHAHMMLVGFVVSFVYALCHKLWLNNVASGLSRVQYYVHQVGTFFMVVGLFLLYGRWVPLETIDPILATASVLVLVGMVLMKVLFIQSMRRA